jgi:hypothetical protein
MLRASGLQADKPGGTAAGAHARKVIFDVINAKGSADRDATYGCGNCRLYTAAT